MLTTHKVFIACTNASGEADMACYDVPVQEDTVSLGAHYDLAQEMAIEDGYEGPFVCFDEHEQKNIARMVSALPGPIPFTLNDSDGGDTSVTGYASFANGAVTTTLKGYSDNTSVDDKGAVSILDVSHGEVTLSVYSDINMESPTHVIGFNSARNEMRSVDV